MHVEQKTRLRHSPFHIRIQLPTTVPSAGWSGYLSTVFFIAVIMDIGFSDNDPLLPRRNVTGLSRSHDIKLEAGSTSSGPEKPKGLIYIGK
jgi:hypothetical protein